MAAPTVKTLKKNVQTPVGTIQWAKLFRPDTKFDEAGRYSVDLILEAANAAPLIAVIDEAAGEFQKEMKKKIALRPYSEVVDAEGNDTGSIKFKTAMKASGKFGPRRPVVVDSKGKQITTPIDIGNGSLMRLSVEIKGYIAGANSGITLGLVAAQLVRLEAYAGGMSSFGAVEGGYEAAETQADTTDGADAFQDEADY
jgi:hypothetical protein